MSRWTKEAENQPMKFLVQIPGVIKTFTAANSNMQALAYALHQAFQTRNEFRWMGKVYSGETGLKSLIADISNYPAFFDYVQALPGLPSQPVEMNLPMVDSAGAPVVNQATPVAKPIAEPVAPDMRTGASLKEDRIDSLIEKCASTGMKQKDIPLIMASAEDSMGVTDVEADVLHAALLKSLPE